MFGPPGRLCWACYKLKQDFELQPATCFAHPWSKDIASRKTWTPDARALSPRNVQPRSAIVLLQPSRGQEMGLFSQRSSQGQKLLRAPAFGHGCKFWGALQDNILLMLTMRQGSSLPVAVAVS